MLLVSDNRRRPHAEALRVARHLVALLSPACAQIEIAGSLRRGRPEVSDVEIVAAPILVEAPRSDLFAPPPMVAGPLEAVLSDLAAAGRLIAHPTRPASGDRYKRLWVARAELQVDLFLVRPPAEWGPILAIRTGPADYSEAAVTALRARGLRCAEGAIWRDRERIPCPDEARFFDLCGMPLLPPERRGLA